MKASFTGVLGGVVVGLGLSAGARAQTAEYAVFLDGKPSGSARLTQELQRDGTKRVVLVVEFSSIDRYPRTLHESVYGADGTPVRQLQRLERGPSEGQQWLATFSDAGAAWTEGKNPVVTRAWPSAVNRRARAEFWFVRDQPAVGARVSHFHLNVRTGQWQTMTTTYVGPTRAAWEGRTVPAHRLRTTRTTAAGEMESAEAVVDGQGIPFTVTEGKLRLERRAISSGDKR